VSPNGPQFESFQIREQGLIDGVKLDGRETLRGRGVSSDGVFELSYPSSVLLETGPFFPCRKPLEGLSNQIVEERKLNRHVVGALTLYPPSFQTSPGRDLSNGRSVSCPAHNASNSGSSKLLEQHARLTAVLPPPDATSSRATSLKISSTLRQACVGSGGCV